MSTKGAPGGEERGPHLAACFAAASVPAQRSRVDAITMDYWVVHENPFEARCVRGGRTSPRPTTHHQPDSATPRPHLIHTTTTPLCMHPGVGPHLATRLGSVSAQRRRVEPITMDYWAVHENPFVARCVRTAAHLAARLATALGSPAQRRRVEAIQQRPALPRLPPAREDGGSGFGIQGFVCFRRLASRRAIFFN